jgi:predicted Zn-dependent protease
MYACRYIPVAEALADQGDMPGAKSLLDAVRGAAPSARSIHDELVDLAFRGGRVADEDAALAAAEKQFPDALEFVVRRANFLKVHQRVDDARALMEKQLLKGVADPTLLGEFLGVVSGEHAARKLLDHYLQLAQQHPELQTLSMVVGVEYHYLHEYEKSTAWLEKAGSLVEREPRVAMYLAMNHFHTGQQQQAEGDVDRAAHAGRPDPDIYYCRAVIEVRKDPGASMRDLERYMALTKGRPDVEPGKQQRVQQTIDLLSTCMHQSDPRACVETEVVQKAKALAFREHYPGEGGAPEPKPEPKPKGDDPKAPPRKPQ